jgi:hypothetical protein
MPPIRFAAVLSLLLAASASATPNVGFSSSTYLAKESDLTTTLTVVRTGELALATTVDYRVTYWGDSGTVSFAPGESSKPLVISTHPDHVWNAGAPKPVEVKLSVATNAAIAIGTTVVNVYDDDPVPTVSINDVQIDEGGNSGAEAPRKVTFTVTLSGPADDSFYFRATTHDGTATAGADYVARTPSASGYDFLFNALQTTANVEVQLLGDQTPEPNETFTLEIARDPSHGSYFLIPIAKAIGTCTILDDDSLLGGPSRRIARGSTEALELQFATPAGAPEIITLTSSNPAIVGVPSTITLPAGALTTSAAMSGLAAGTATVTATLPASRGGRAYAVLVSVFEAGTLSFDRTGVTLPAGSATTVNAHLDPAPAVPATIVLSQSDASVAAIPASITIGPDGNASLPIQGLRNGVTSILATPPDSLGGVATGLRVEVTGPTLLAVTRLVTKSSLAYGLQLVTLEGSFSGRCVVTFGGIPGRDTTLPSFGTITTIAPAHDPGVVDLGVRCGSEAVTLPAAFTFTPAPITLTQLIPSTGSVQGGTVLSLAGTNLRSGVCRYTLGGAPLQPLESNAYALIAEAPAHVAGAVDAIVTCGSDRVTLLNAFTYVEAVPANTIQETGSYGAPGEVLSLQGTNFRHGDTIFVGAQPATTYLVRGQSITSFVPELATGFFALSIHHADGTSTLGGGMQVAARKPVILKSVPTVIAPGGELTITATGVRPGLVFLLGTTALTPINLDPLGATLRVPAAMVPGRYNLTVGDPGSVQQTFPGIEVKAAHPVILSVSRPCAPPEGGTFVTIHGGNFVSGAVVQFDRTYSADSTVLDSTTIRAAVPPSFHVSNATITVFNPEGSSATLTNAFSYDIGCIPYRLHSAGH